MTIEENKRNNDREKTAIKLGGSNYNDMSLYLRRMLSHLFITDVGNEKPIKNNRHRESSTYFRKDDEQGRYICARIADHLPFFQMYYRFGPKIPPSIKPYGNICIIFNGVQEMSCTSAIDLIPSDILQDTIIVKEEDYDLYKPFDFQIHHYRPGQLFEKDKELIKNEIIRWSLNNGNKPFENPIMLKGVYNGPISGKVFIEKQNISESAPINLDGGYIYKLPVLYVKVVDINNKHIRTDIMYFGIYGVDIEDLYFLKEIISTIKITPQIKNKKSY